MKRADASQAFRRGTHLSGVDVDGYRVELFIPLDDSEMQGVLQLLRVRMTRCSERLNFGVSREALDAALSRAEVRGFGLPPLREPGQPVLDDDPEHRFRIAVRLDDVTFYARAHRWPTGVVVWSLHMDPERATIWLSRLHAMDERQFAPMPIRQGDVEPVPAEREIDA